MEQTLHQRRFRGSAGAVVRFWRTATWHRRDVQSTLMLDRVGVCLKLLWPASDLAAGSRCCAAARKKQ